MLCFVSTLVSIAGEEWVRCFVNCTLDYITQSAYNHDLFFWTSK